MTLLSSGLLVLAFLSSLVISKHPLDEIEDPKVFRSSFALRRIPELTPRSQRSPVHIPVYYGRQKRGGYTSNGGVYSRFNGGPQYHEERRHRRPPYSGHHRPQGQFGGKYYEPNEYERIKSHNYNRYEDEEKAVGYRGGGGYGDFEREFGDYDEDRRNYEVIYYKAQTSPPDYEDGRSPQPEILEYDDGRAVVISSEEPQDDGTKHVFDEDPGFGGREESNDDAGNGIKVSSSSIDSFGGFF